MVIIAAAYLLAAPVQAVKRVTVFGAVKQPQFFTYTTPPSAHEVLALAGIEAKASNTLYFRKANGSVEPVSRVDSVLKTRKLADRDVLYVPFSGSKPAPVLAQLDSITALDPAATTWSALLRADGKKYGTLVLVSGEATKGFSWSTVANANVMVAFPRVDKKLGPTDTLVLLPDAIQPTDLGKWQDGELVAESEEIQKTPPTAGKPDGKDIVVFGLPTAASEWRSLRWSPDLTVEDCLGQLSVKPEFIFLDNPAGKIPERVKPDRFATLKVPPGSTLVVPGAKSVTVGQGITVVLINEREASVWKGRAGTLQEVADKALALEGSLASYKLFLFRPIAGEKPLISAADAAMKRKLAPGTIAILYTRHKE